MSTPLTTCPGCDLHGRLHWLLGALLATGLPVVEVHLSNPAAREDFRHRSLIAGACLGTVTGFGAAGYEAAYLGLRARLSSD